MRPLQNDHSFELEIIGKETVSIYFLFEQSMQPHRKICKHVNSLNNSSKLAINALPPDSSHLSCVLFHFLIRGLI